MTPSQKMRALWSVPTAYPIEDELESARESALLHAKALDEARRELARTRRKMQNLVAEFELRMMDMRRDRQQLVLEIFTLRRTCRVLQETLDEVQKLVNE